MNTSGQSLTSSEAPRWRSRSYLTRTDSDTDTAVSAIFRTGSKFSNSEFIFGDYSVDLEEYEFLSVIGYSSVSGEASVYLAKYLPREEFVAVKVVDVEAIKPYRLEQKLKELYFLREMTHPNIANFHVCFVKEQILYIVMPYMSGGSCLNVMLNAHPNGFNEIVIASILKEVLKAVLCMHNAGYLHRNIKAANILLSEKGVVKLADFRNIISVYRNGEQLKALYDYRGTNPLSTPWLAPEVLRQDMHGYNMAADIFNIGVLALELAFGKAPFEDVLPSKLLLFKLRFPPPTVEDCNAAVGRKCSKAFRSFVNSCLRHGPERRPSIRKLLGHPFIKAARRKRIQVLSELFVDMVPLPERPVMYFRDDIEASAEFYGDDGEVLQEEDEDVREEDEVYEHEEGPFIAGNGIPPNTDGWSLSEEEDDDDEEDGPAEAEAVDGMTAEANEDA
eukprot:Clim_evm55s77 gene=Clim_evmTU55s77